MPHHRYAVLADIHGNVPALEAVLEEISHSPVDGVLIAGDLVGGPDGDGVIERLASYEATTVLGNGEEAVLAFEHGEVAPEQRADLQWAFTRTCFHRTGLAAMSTMKRLQPQLSIHQDGTSSIRVVHGTTASSTEVIRPDRNPERISEILDEMAGTILIGGHTHEQWIFHHAGKFAFNPGSVGGPCNGDNRAQYATLTWDRAQWTVAHHTVAYDLERVRAAFIDSGFLEEAGPMARAQLEGIFHADRTLGDLVRYARDMAMDEGLGKIRFVPDEIWLRAVSSFRWRLPAP